MPELPEVETVKRVIGPQIKGRLIENVIVNRRKLYPIPVQRNFAQRLKGRLFPVWNAEENF